MTVGINAKIGPAAPEAAPAGAADSGGEGGDFAQLLTGIAAGPPHLTGKVAHTTVVRVVTPIVGTDDGDGAKPVAGDDSVNPGIAQCVIGLHDLSARLGRIERFLKGAPKDGEAAEGDGEQAGNESKSDGDPVITADVAAAPTAVTVDAALLLQANARPAAQPPAPAVAGEQVAQAAVIQVGAAQVAMKEIGAGKPDTATLPDLPQADAAMPAELAKLLDFTKRPEAPKPAELQQLMRALMHGDRHAGDKAPVDAAVALTTSAQGLDAGADDQAFAGLAPFSASPMLNGSLQGLVQPQLGVDGFSTAAPAGTDAAATTTEPDLAIERHLDIEHDAQWLDRLARDIARTAGNEGPLRFRLHPETLGSLHVEVSQNHSGTSVRLTADTEAARSIIADAQSRLVAEARAQGVRIAETYVGMNSNGQPDQRRQDDGRQEGFVRTLRSAEPEPDQPDTSASAAAERFA